MIPYRNRRYEYAFDLIEDIEQRQCVNCVFAEPTDSSIMCMERQVAAMLEEDVPDFEEKENHYVVCNAFEPKH